MKIAKAFWRIGTRLLALFTMATALLLILFSGLKGHAASLQELPLAESAANLPLHRMHISPSATISPCELDVVLILDRSGSMQEDTICFGCYEVGSSIYPAGARYPLRWPYNGTVEPWPRPHGPPPPCDPVGGPLETIVIEAEFYDFTNRLYQRKFTIFGDSYWALQRPNRYTGNCSGSNSRTCGSSSLDPIGANQRGAYMMHMPHGAPGTAYTSYDPSNYRIPRLDYQVEVQADTYYVFVRGQGGAGWLHDLENPAEGARQAKLVYWGIDRSCRGETERFADLVQGGYNEPVVGPDSWRWTRLSGSVSFGQPGEHTLNIWAGGLGFRLDKIILSTNANYVPGGYSGEGPDETGGRDPNGLACDPCNPNYCLRLDEPWDCNNLYDDLYDDDQPIRFLKEAAKRFTYQLDPSVDQIGLVTYGIVGSDNRATIDQYLQCLVQDGDDCTDFDVIVDAIEVMDADGGTNIPDGIRQGMEVFAHENSRSAAAHVMILMTDGQTNSTDGLPPECWAEDLWDPPSNNSEQDRSRDCVVYYTNAAQEAGYVIYTISLGAQADIELLEYVAEETGAQHYNAPRMEDLSAIFDAISQDCQPLDCYALDISKAATPTVSMTGGPFTYTIAVSNTGARNPTGVFIQDALPAGMTFVTASGVFSPTHPVGGEVVVWNVNALPDDSISLILTVVLTTATAPETTQFVNTATVTCTQGLSASESATVTVGESPLLRWFLYLPIILKDKPQS